MNKAITVELQFFLISILAGAFILFVYDGLRIIRRLIKHNVYWVAVQDLIFWVVASVFIFSMIYKENNGIIRGFCIMGMAIGMTLYHYIFSDWLVEIITKLIRLVLSPITAALRWVKGLLFFVHRKLTKLSKNLLFQLKKLAKSVKIALNKKKQKRELLHNERRKEKLKKRKEKEKLDEQKSKKKSQASKIQKPKKQKSKKQKPKNQIAKNKNKKNAAKDKAIK